MDTIGKTTCHIRQTPDGHGGHTNVFTYDVVEGEKVVHFNSPSLLPTPIVIKNYTNRMVYFWLFDANSRRVSMDKVTAILEVPAQKDITAKLLFSFFKEGIVFSFSTRRDRFLRPQERNYTVIFTEQVPAPAKPPKALPQ